MKRFLILCLVLVGMTVQTSAQTKFKGPKFTKVLQVKSKGLNIRKAPTTSSPVIGKNPDYLLVIDETDEWYHAYIPTDGEDKSLVGYVSKKVCKAQDAKQINNAYIQHCAEDANISMSTRQSGKYKGYSVIRYNLVGYGHETCLLFIGKNLGTVCVGKLYEYQDGDSYTIRLDLGLESNGKELNVPLSYGEYGKINVNKLTDSDIDKLLSFGNDKEIHLLFASKMEFYYSADEVVTGDGVWTYQFDNSKYTGETTLY